MSSNPVVAANNLTKKFKLFRRSRDRVLELFGLGKRHRDFNALSDISFELNQGEAIGIIGENGSGKSTLLKLIAGILIPDKGQIERNGKITGLLELGTGFNPELSGRANIYLNGVYLGLSKRELTNLEKEIIAFAELEEFIDEPLKNYSSGMTMRLGFAIAIHARPACFIIDEALSVGDARFQQKCYAKLREFRAAGGCLLFVSHDLNAIKLLCDRALLLSHGKNKFLGDPEEAVNRFNELLASRGLSGQNTDAGYGSAAIYFSSVQILDATGKPTAGVVSGQPMSIQFAWKCNKPVSNVTFGVMLRDGYGQDIYGTNGALLHQQIDVNGPGLGRFEFAEMNLGKGNYSINLAAHTGATHLEQCFHWWDNAASFEILENPAERFSGLTRLKTSLIYEKI